MIQKYEMNEFRPANQEQVKHHANSRYNPSVSALLAWKIGLAKFQCCMIFFGTLPVEDIENLR